MLKAVCTYTHHIRTSKKIQKNATNTVLIKTMLLLANINFNSLQKITKNIPVKKNSENPNYDILIEKVTNV